MIREIKIVDCLVTNLLKQGNRSTFDVVVVEGGTHPEAMLVGAKVEWTCGGSPALLLYFYEPGGEGQIESIPTMVQYDYLEEYCKNMGIKGGGRVYKKS